MAEPPPPDGGDPNDPYREPPSSAPPAPDPYPGSGYPLYPAPAPYPGGRVPYGAAGLAGPLTNPLALVSLICGIAGLVLMFFCGLGLLPAIAALITGFIARGQIAQSARMQGGSGMALSGIITGAVAVALSILVILLGLAINAFQSL